MRTPAPVILALTLWVAAAAGTAHPTHAHPTHAHPTRAHPSADRTSSGYVPAADTLPYRVPELRALGGEALVAMARELVVARQLPAPIDFDDFMPSVWANGDKVEVRFARKLIFEEEYRKPYQEVDFDVDLVTGIIRPFDDVYHYYWYTPSMRGQEILGFLRERRGLPVAGGVNLVSETDDYYYVSVRTELSGSMYHVDKVTGEDVLEPLHVSYVKLPELAREQIGPDGHPLPVAEPMVRLY